jgi:hypothetical protein
MESPASEDQTPNDQLLLARILLTPQKGRDPAWPALAAAAFFAVSAMAFAMTAIMTPARDDMPVPVQHHA